ncbi:hypothetical protein MKW98_020673 [Papaver atlanticum]|uniref:HIG1 domain-containing protein n=1 Tax=Papaver atlanticum TaxID=357466 RepID=A0AAD4TIJ2_9MAGN|nr:hypothetical protein MKW98_020673 [Papaver atlanticum]
MESIKSWVLENKLASLGTFWASAIGASLVYTRAKSPYNKTSVRLIHARMHAQALTLAVLSGAAVLHYYDQNKQTQSEEERNIAPAAPLLN